jgi:hypothetical protein
MTLKELKNSTLYQSSDLDDLEVMVCVSRNGKRQLEPLCFLGMAPTVNPTIAIVGGLTEIQRMVENGEMERPEAYIDPAFSNPIIFNENEDKDKE